MIKSSCLLITDYYSSSVNGISLFTISFIENYLQKKYYSIIILELSTQKKYFINKNSKLTIENIYVNAHYSESDIFLKNTIGKFKFHKNYNISKEPNKIIISHGWIKIKFRIHYYYLYYSLKNYFKSKNLKGIDFYDKIIFISKNLDSFRHLDYQYVQRKSIDKEFFDFENYYKQSFSKIKNNYVCKNEKYILIISNFDIVKNIFSIFYSKYFKKLKIIRGVKKIKILTPSSNTLYFIFFKFLCKVFSFELINNNDSKFELVANCDCLYTPSITEYLPLVTLEAFSLKKDVYSLYKINSLTNNTNYYYFLK